MSDDDYSSYGPGGAVGLGSASKQRGPRFAWTLQYEDTFFRSLCDSATTGGLREGSTFKSEAWDRAIRAINTKHNAYPSKSHLINKSDNARKKFRLWRGLREDPEFQYNEHTRTVTASDEAWSRKIAKDPQCRALKGRPFDHEQYFNILFSDVIGSGGAPKRITKAKRKLIDEVAAAELGGTSSLDVLGDTSYAPSTSSAQRPIAGPSNPSLPAGILGPSSAGGAAAPNAAHLGSTALTPPEENGPHVRKRFMPTDAASAAANSNKRRRTTSAIDVDALPSGPAAASTEGLATLAELMRAVKVRRTWADQGLEIFFRDFAEEDYDLQLKIAEKVLSDETKAMVFCKMSVPLRKHWMNRLREMHHRTLTL